MSGGLRATILSRLPDSLVSGLRGWYRRRLIRRFPRRIVEHTYGGHRLQVALVDPLSAGWYDCDWPVLPEIEHLRQSRLRPGARVFNLGAHQGVVALMLAREVGEMGHVIAVEPVAHNAETATTNRDLNAASQLTILQAAVTAECGTITFKDGLQGSALGEAANTGDSFLADAVTIDDMASRFGLPDVVFMDVEGAEHLVLAGAAAVLASGADFSVELHVGCGLEALGGSVDHVLAYFPEDRFQLFVRAERDNAFQAFTPETPLLQSRCFLLALSRVAVLPTVHHNLT